MPIQIKIKSSGADISEYGPSGGGGEKEGEKPPDKDPVTSTVSMGHPDKDEQSKETTSTEPSSDSVDKDTSDEVTKSDSKDSGDGKSASEEINYEYEGDDVFYTDQSTKVRYKWDTEKNSWASEDGNTVIPPTPQNPSDAYEFDGETYVYKDEKGVKHRWNTKDNKWDEQEESEESEEDDNTTEEQRKARQYRKRKAAPGWDATKYEKDEKTGKTIYKSPTDGMTYEWDEGKKAWFPLIGEDFMAVYQLNYGFTNDLESKPTVPDPVEEKPAPPPPQPKQKKIAKKEPEPAKWFDADDKKTTKVYVSRLPEDITEEEFAELMGKCGMVEHDIRTKKSKLKLYKDKNGMPKGDGLCSYIKAESVELALTILDGSEFKGKKISVERAKFEMKGEAYDPKLKPKKLNKKEREKAEKQKERLFAWIPDKMKGERMKHEKVIVIKNLFDPLEFDRDPGLILDYNSRIRAQCNKFGSVTKLVLYDKHEEGICQVFFKEPMEADMAVDMLHGRLFGKRLMNVQTWDGRTKYKKNESAEEEAVRLAAWEKYLEGEEEEEPKQTTQAMDTS